MVSKHDELRSSIVTKLSILRIIIKICNLRINIVTKLCRLRNNMVSKLCRLRRSMVSKLSELRINMVTTSNHVVKQCLHCNLIFTGRCFLGRKS
ncbi:hypothetical protein V6N12_005418 [Hibiscus sabdariffa]|uniref:Uncharacterized protein n=1 Tax=Hibiscus sabdariffa TaxID=183260 RepID=A0ABR2A840_9ROSI